MEITTSRTPEQDRALLLDALKDAVTWLHEIREEFEEKGAVARPSARLLALELAVQRVESGAEPRPRAYVACAQCGCTDLEYEGWVNANTGEATDLGVTKGYYCPQCEQHEVEGTTATQLQPVAHGEDSDIRPALALVGGAS